jgi:hypothetical protein
MKIIILLSLITIISSISVFSATCTTYNCWIPEFDMDRCTFSTYECNPDGFDWSFCEASGSDVICSGDYCGRSENCIRGNNPPPPPTEQRCPDVGIGNYCDAGPNCNGNVCQNPCDCGAAGWYDAPFWGGCGDAASCDGQGTAYAYCNGCNWDTNWGNHQCVASNPSLVCSPGSTRCNGAGVETCAGSGCSWGSYSSCGTDGYTGNKRCNGNSIESEYITYGCSGGGCTSSLSWVATSSCSGETTCSGGGCVAACGDGADNDGDGFRDGQDTECGGCGQCNSGCCNLANGCTLDGDSGAATCGLCGTWFATGATAGATPNCCGDDAASDNFYYQNGNPAVSTSMTCNRCASGANAAGTIYGNGYLDDANNLCYYGDMTCNAATAGNGASEECQDACVNDNDGGACTTTHNPAAAETCYTSETCTDGSGCAFSSSGALRQNYCDTCGATGVTSLGAAYCPTPSTWEDTTCYYGTQTCTGATCNLNIGTTLCAAGNSSCCVASSDLINDGVSCNAATGPQGAQFDRDSSQARCESSAQSCTTLNWINGGEATPFGEYAAGNALACCGDDANEFFTTAGVGADKCCSAAGMCTDAGGMCRSGQEDTKALCTNGIDDDCDGTIDSLDSTCFGTVNGTVYDGDNSGYVVQGANVKSSPPGMASSFERNDASDIQGYYSLTNVFVGTYNIVARKDGYIDDIVEVTVLAGQNVQQDFYLYTGVNCKADCTDGRNICNKACAGLTFNDGTCNFVNSSCHNRPKDYKYTFVDAANQYHEITCCEGPEAVYPALKPEVEGNVDNLFDQAVPVKINGKTYIMHILVWN